MYTVGAIRQLSAGPGSHLLRNITKVRLLILSLTYTSCILSGFCGRQTLFCLMHADLILSLYKRPDSGYPDNRMPIVNDVESEKQK